MTRNDDVLERLAPLSGAPSHGYEDLLRLRARYQLARKIGAMAVVTALIVALVGIGLAISDRSEKTANPPERSSIFTGMVIRYTGDHINPQPGDLVAVDPATNEVITLAAASDFRDNTMAWSAASADGRWVAFENAFCDDRPSVADWERRSGLWITNGTDESRQLTTPCLEDTETLSGNWAWAPSGSQLAVAEGDHLVLIDPATGDRRDLGQATGDVNLPTWSPDGSQIAYETLPSGAPADPAGNSKHDAIYVVSVDGGEHTLIEESLGQIPGLEEGTGIAWSPDGTHLAVLARGPGVPPWNATLYVMNADGSGRRQVAEGLLTEHSLGSTNIVWSPDGTRIAYATVPDDAYAFGERHPFQFRVWSAAPDGSSRVLVFDGTERANNGGLFGGPVWSPDGSQIAFRYDPTEGERRWLVASADGSGDPNEVDELQPLSWRGGWYFCECMG